MTSSPDIRASPPTPRGLAAALVAGAVLVSCGYLAVELFLLDGGLGLPLDDSWIHLQFARNVAGGDGLSYNPGEPVTGSTSPLWTALLSLAFLLPGSPVLSAKAAGALCYAGTVVAARRLALELGARRGTALLAAMATLLTSWLAWSALSGMEICLFSLLSTWALALHLEERRDPSRPPRSWVLLAASALARPEGILLIVLALLDRLLLLRERPGLGLVAVPPPWRRVARGALVALLVVAPVAAVYWSIGGSPLPTTFAAKSASLRRWLPDPAYLRTALGILFTAQPALLLTAGAGAVALVRRLGTPRDRGLLPVLWLAGLPCAYALLSPGDEAVLVGNFGRYLFPLFPVVAVLGALGVEGAGRRLAGGLRLGGWRLPLGAAGVLLLLLPPVVELVQGAGRYGGSVADVQESDVRMARWLRPRLHPEALLAVNDIGAFKYFLPNRVLDLAGIIHPEVRTYMAKAMAAGEGWQEGTRRFLAEHRPDYLVVFPGWFPELVAPDSPYEPLYVLPLPDNRTMGGSELVLMATPWTRHPLATLPSRPGDPRPVPPS